MKNYKRYPTRNMQKLVPIRDMRMQKEEGFNEV